MLTSTLCLQVKCKAAHCTPYKQGMIANNWWQIACKTWACNQTKSAYTDMIAQPLCLILVLNAEIAPEEALLEAINQPLLHNMELHHISHAHTTGHVWLFFYSKAHQKRGKKTNLIRDSFIALLTLLGGEQSLHSLCAARIFVVYSVFDSRCVSLQ